MTSDTSFVLLEKVLKIGSWTAKNVTEESAALREAEIRLIVSFQYEVVRPVNQVNLQVSWKLENASVELVYSSFVVGKL